MREGSMIPQREPFRDTKNKQGGGNMVNHLIELFTVHQQDQDFLKRGLASVVEHPLDPLSAEEISAAAALCKARAVQEGVPALRFNTITLQEPPKAELLGYQKNPLTAPTPSRKAFCILQLPRNGSTIVEAMVDFGLVTPAIVSWREVEGVQPMVTGDDCVEAEEILKADVALQTLVRERYGITNLDMLACDPWYYGDRFVSEGVSMEGRIITAFMYMRAGPMDNHYAHPLDLVCIVDMNTRKVIGTWMHSKPPEIPKMNSNFVPQLMEKPVRKGLKPLNVVQPEGPSFEVQGNAVTWQKWHLRIGFNYREGLVLHNIGYEDQGRVRPIMHRASIAEIIVPYGDPRQPFSKKCAFDVMDYGLGYSANSLDLGCDCLGHIKYFDAMLCNSKGEPLLIKKAVCMHEEDYGLLWKHMEYRTGEAWSRRSRRLVISFIATIANYEYGFFWYLYQDGTIQHEAKLTGILSTNGLSEGESKPAHGTLIAPVLNAQIHQHFFCARLDMAVDDANGGAHLTLTELNCEPMPTGPDNPSGHGFRVKETELTSELQAQRNMNPLTSRAWKIKNLNSRNVVTGDPVAWKLIPMALPPLYCQPDSQHARRGAFATKHFWATKHADDELYPAGMYPVQVEGSDGIREWTSMDRKLSKSDIVVWHTFGITHIPRIEDWPVMPCEYCGFYLKPCGFFDCNPGMDIPVGKNTASREVASPGSPKFSSKAAAAPKSPAGAPTTAHVSPSAAKARPPARVGSASSVDENACCSSSSAGSAGVSSTRGLPLSRL